MCWFISFVYIFFVYGASMIVTNGIGPKNIFVFLRAWAESVGPNFGLLFRCMMCAPTNIAIIVTLLFWFIFPGFCLTPATLLLGAFRDSWYVAFMAAVMDGCICAGISHFIWNLDDFIDKSTPIYEDEYDKNNTPSSDDRIILND